MLSKSSSLRSQQTTTKELIPSITASANTLATQHQHCTQEPHWQILPAFSMKFRRGATRFRSQQTGQLKCWNSRCCEEYLKMEFAKCTRSKNNNWVECFLCAQSGGVFDLLTHQRIELSCSEQQKSIFMLVGDAKFWLHCFACCSAIHTIWLVAWVTADRRSTTTWSLHQEKPPTSLQTTAGHKNTPKFYGNGKWFHKQIQNGCWTWTIAMVCFEAR